MIKMMAMVMLVVMFSFGMGIDPISLVVVNVVDWGKGQSGW